MATKPRRFEPAWYYHVYNCGVEKRRIFDTGYEYQRFIYSCLYYQSNQKLSFSDFLMRNKNPSGSIPEITQKVNILAYCLMPNHFHLLLQPVYETGLSQFVSDISNSLTKYYNKRYKRLGRLLQGPFKSKAITSEESLLQVARYIHLNPVASRKLNPSGLLLPEFYPYSNYTAWVYPQGNPTGSSLQDKAHIKSILEEYGGGAYYRNFVESKVKTLNFSGIGNLIIEESV